jgi:hypothetical protein
MNDIAGLRLRIVTIQDALIHFLNTSDDQEACQAAAETLSWSMGADSILGSLRVELMIDGKDHTEAMDTLSTIRNQVNDTVKTFRLDVERGE